MSFTRRDLPIIILFVVSIIMVLAYFIPASTVPAIKAAENELNTWGIILQNFTFFSAGLSLILYHTNRARKKSEGWQYGMWSVIVMVIMIIVGITFGSTSSIYENLYKNTAQPISSTMWLVMCLFMISAAYRAFKVRSLKGLIMMASCVLVMLKNAPIGEAIWSGFGPLGKWISDYPNTGGNRAFIICAAVGALIIGFRTMFGYETRHFGSDIE